MVIVLEEPYVFFGVVLKRKLQRMFWESSSPTHLGRAFLITCKMELSAPHHVSWIGFSPARSWVGPL